MVGVEWSRRFKASESDRSWLGGTWPESDCLLSLHLSGGAGGGWGGGGESGGEETVDLLEV